MRKGERKTHCKRGHALVGENVYIRPSASIRECVTCRRAAEKLRVKGVSPRAVEERFFAATIPSGDCWEFQRLDHAGYGRFWINGRSVRAHRWCFEFMVGEIPPGLFLDHLCRNRSCVNPDHLEPVTPRINTLRGETVPAANLWKTHCWRGHPLSGDNLRRDPRGRRRCRACHRINAAAYRARKAA